MPDQPPAIVQTVAQQLPLPQPTEMSLNRAWHIEPNEQSKRLMAQPAWKTRIENAQPALQPLEIVQEEDGDTTSAAASMWSPPDGYQLSTCMQRAADAAKDAQDNVDLSDADGMNIGSSRLKASTELALSSLAAPHSPWHG